MIKKMKLTATAALIFSLQLISACGGGGSGQDSNEKVATLDSRLPYLGKALERPTQQIITDPAEKVPLDNTGGWEIDTQDRQLVRQFYNSVYLASDGTPFEWTGNHASCDAGTTSNEFNQAVLARINYYRAMAGVPADIQLNTTFNAKAQEAALIMSANNALDHTPPTNWLCYTANGYEAASSSNLSLGSFAWSSIDGQVRDNGSNNTPVGHRRWILYPQTKEMGTGNIPFTESHNAANAVWVFDGRYSDPRPATRDTFVAWPSPGFNPYTLAPARWSFSYPGANFSAATVSMTKDGVTIATAIQNRSSTIGEPAIVWVPGNLDPNDYASRWPKPASDESYWVTISNVVIDGVQQSFNYPVTVFDPQTSLNEQSSQISGDSSPVENQSTSYQFNAINHALGYEALVAELGVSFDPFDAEDGGASVIDKTDASYSLVYQGAGTAGNLSRVYRLAPATSSESFEIPTVFIPSATSRLTFDSMLGWATESQIASLQVSTDDGISWKDVFTQVGAAGAPVDTRFISRSISMAQYADKMIRIRVAFQHSGWRYLGTDPAVSFLVDNLTLTNAKKVVVENKINTRTNLNFNFTPLSSKSYALSVRSIFWEGYPATEWGPLFYVTPVANSAFTLDIDNDNTVAPLTDGLLTLRFLFGFNGTALITGAVGEDAARTTSTEIEAYLQSGIDSKALDIDGDNEVMPLTDGLLVLRHLFGFTGDGLIAGAIGDNATRKSANDVEAYLKSIIP